MIVLDRGVTIEVYGERDDEDDDAYIWIASGSDDELPEGAWLLACRHEDGEWYDRRGQKLDGLRFLRAYQMVLMSRALDRKLVSPEKVYYSPVFNESRVRIGLTAELFYLIESKRTRDLIISKLFDVDRRFARVYTDVAIEDFFEGLGVELHARERQDPRTGQSTIVLALGPAESNR